MGFWSILVIGWALGVASVFLVAVISGSLKAAGPMSEFVASLKEDDDDDHYDSKS